MPRKPHLKVFRAHLGFYDTVVAASSQKAALAAWGAHRDEFAKGFAAVTDDLMAVKAALAQPGVVLKREYGRNGEFMADPVPLHEPKLSLNAKVKLAKAKQKKQKAIAKQRKGAQVIEEAERAHDKTLRAIEAREAALQKERAAADHEFARRVRKTKRRA
jgi:colicin import membrane protein